MARILVVEDEKDLADLLVYNLRQSGHETEISSTGAGALAKASAFKPDLVLLDLMLPDISGLEVIRMMRSTLQQNHTAVMMLTAKGAETDRVQGFEVGADDYVVKPFSVREVLLRVDAILRRLLDAPKDDAPLVAGDIQVDPERHEVTVKGEPVLLTPL